MLKTQICRTLSLGKLCSSLSQLWKYLAKAGLYNLSHWLLGTLSMSVLTHWGRVTHNRVGKLIIVDSDNGLSPERRQAIIWTNAEILLIGPLGTNFSEILIEILTISLKKICLKCRLRNFVLFVSASIVKHKVAKISLLCSSFLVLPIDIENPYRLSNCLYG